MIVVTHMLPLKVLKQCVRASTETIKGNTSEKIIQNTLVHHLRVRGFLCQEEVVLPVMAGNIFAGYNRFDIIVGGDRNNSKSFTIIELKTLTKKVGSKFPDTKYYAQCIGYKRCAQRFFGTGTNVSVLFVNILNKYNISRQEVVEIIPVTESEIVKASQTKKEKKTTGISKMVLRKRTSSKQRHY